MVAVSCINCLLVVFVIGAITIRLITRTSDVSLNLPSYNQSSTEGHMSPYRSGGGSGGGGSGGAVGRQQWGGGC